MSFQSKAKLAYASGVTFDTNGQANQVQLDSPTVERVSTMIFLHLMTSLGWTQDWLIGIIGDVSNAFRQGTPLTRHVCAPPKRGDPRIEARPDNHSNC